MYEKFPEVDLDQPILDISPTNINIEFVLNKESVFEIKLRNTTTQPVAFKIKTTSPDSCQVRPIQDIVLPNETAKCTIVMSEFTEFPQDPKALRYKFLLLSIPYENESRTMKDIVAMWRAAEAYHRQSNLTIYHEQRISCAFQPPKTTKPDALEQRIETLNRTLADKNVQFDNLMEFSIKQNAQMRTLTVQLQTRDEDIKNHKLTIMNLEKQILNLTKAQAEQRTDKVPNETAKTEEVVEQGFIDHLKAPRSVVTWHIIALCIVVWFLAYLLHRSN